MTKTQYEEIIRILRKKVSSRARLITSINTNLKLNIPKSTNYQKLLEKLVSSGNEKKFSKKMYNLSSFNEIIEKEQIDDALYAFPKETLVLIAEQLSDKKKKWKFTKTNVSDLKRTLVFNTQKSDYQKLFPQLIQKQQIPNLIQHYKAVVGPLGITNSTVERSGYDADNLVEFLSYYITSNTMKDFLEHSSFIPTELPMIDEKLLPIAIQQLIITYGSDDEIRILFNTLIENEIIQINSDEYYSIGIVTPYGVIYSNFDDPIQELISYVLKKTSHDALDYHLREDGYASGPLELRLYGKCLVIPPEKILDHEFGMNDLREIGKNLGLVRLEKLTKKNLLIKYILLALGFITSTEISGISKFISDVEELQTKIESEKDPEKLSGLVMNVYVLSEKILKDLIYFHIAIFWSVVQQEEDKESKLALARKIIREEFKEKKDFSKPSFGQLVYLMKTMNNYVTNNPTRLKLIQNTLGRDYVFPPQELEHLIKINESRAQFSHDSSSSKQNEFLSSNEIINNLISVAKQFKAQKIYPITFRIKSEVTNEYGTSYYEAISEDNKNWKILNKDWLAPGTMGMMYSRTDEIAVFPFLVIKYW